MVVKRVALYARVSTEDQTVDQQIAEMVRRCESEGWEYETFTDVISGAKTSRTALNAMMQRIREGKYDALMVTKLDRLGRSLQHLIQIILELNNRSVRFISLQLNVDTTTPTGIFFIQIMGAMAELERGFIRERTQEKIDYVKDQIAKNGFYVNRDGKKITRLGRPPGSKDKGRRRRSGYIMREVKKRKKVDEDRGIYKDMETYIK